MQAKLLTTMMGRSQPTAKKATARLLTSMLARLRGDGRYRGFPALPPYAESKIADERNRGTSMSDSYGAYQGNAFADDAYQVEMF